MHINLPGQQWWENKVKARESKTSLRISTFEVEIYRYKSSVWEPLIWAEKSSNIYRNIPRTIGEHVKTHFEM